MSSLDTNKVTVSVVGDPSLDKKKKYNKRSMNEQGITTNNWGTHFLMGFDYEYLGGFQLGLEYGLGLSSMAKCNDTIFNWTLKPSLGYNFAKLLK